MPNKKIQNVIIVVHVQKKVIKFINIKMNYFVPIVCFMNQIKMKWIWTVVQQLVILYVESIQGTAMIQNIKM